MPIDDVEHLLGKTLLVGVTYLDDHGAVERSVEFAGPVIAVDPLVAIEVSGSPGPFTLPPEPDAFDAAGPGQYNLRNGEVVIDPDFLTIWTVTPPSERA